MRVMAPLALKSHGSFKLSHFIEWTLTRPSFWAKGSRCILVLGVLRMPLQIPLPSLSTLPWGSVKDRVKLSALTSDS